MIQESYAQVWADCLNISLERARTMLEVEQMASEINETRRDDNRKFSLFRRYYELRHDELMERCEKNRWLCPYDGGLDWSKHMTHIEFDVWHDIRGNNFPLYPQYPVGRRFADFGNPYHKIAVEADSVAWHNAENDRARDVDLRELGWQTFRIPSAKLKNPPVDYEEFSDLYREEAMRRVTDWLSSNVEGLIAFLRYEYADDGLHALRQRAELDEDDMRCCIERSRGSWQMQAAE